MKKLGQIMSELGFRAEGSDATKAAFIRYLAKATLNSNLETPTDLKSNVEVGPFPQSPAKGEQLEFDLGDNGPRVSTHGANKKSG